MIPVVLLVLACSLASTVSAAPTQPACVPDQKTFYWKSPCDGQSFTNRITISNLTATQRGILVDDAGGLDSGTDLDIITAVSDQYGVIKDPKVDIVVMEYSKNVLGKCTWKKVPTFGMFDNLDACDIVKNCHFNDDPTTLNAALNIKAISGALYFGIDTNTYYGLSLTFKDGKTPVFCIYAQDIIIKK